MKPHSNTSPPKGSKSGPPPKGVLLPTEKALKVLLCEPKPTNQTLQKELWAMKWAQNYLETATTPAMYGAPISSTAFNRLIDFYENRLYGA